jgi:hypothetical protein
MCGVYCEQVTKRERTQAVVNLSQGRLCGRHCLASGREVVYTVLESPVAVTACVGNPGPINIRNSHVPEPRAARNRASA